MIELLLRLLLIIWDIKTATDDDEEEVTDLKKLTALLAGAVITFLYLYLFGGREQARLYYEGLRTD